ncbi:uncharacterized protein K02A2.6-like [Octopus bimaculoides]|uniref:uncharacterized protein K02A2.6-like n=1 Tax=Octopus bimaculoides TaxID=37653 RepID=UPI00071C95E1|nr:uncharacterized protein K02A2.6-like [Octopus bimaculoides]|eukprot:XP_014786684.1 PREDICTED: uncharacterized protein K02A2.6-like [Octopus bimaculoides]
MQLDTGGDITIVDEETWKYIGEPKLRESRTVAHGVTDKILVFVGESVCNITFRDQMKREKVCVLKNSINLFGTEWMELFKMWNTPISVLCGNIVGSVEGSTVVEGLKRKIKHLFPDVFSDELGCCTKTRAKVVEKQSATLVFKSKRNAPFAALEQVNKELESLEIIEKTDHSDWAASTVYVIKKNKLRVDFSTGLNDCLSSHSYPFPSPEEVFAKLNGGKFLSKLDLSAVYLHT